MSTIDVASAFYLGMVCGAGLVSIGVVVFTYLVARREGWDKK